MYNTPKGKSTVSEQQNYFMLVKLTFKEAN